MRRKQFSIPETKLPEYKCAIEIIDGGRLPTPLDYFSATDDDLAHYGINKGDVLLLYPTTTIHEDQITYIESKDEVSLGFIFENFGDISITHKDGIIWSSRWKKSEIEKMAVVVGIIKPFRLEEDESFMTKTDGSDFKAVCEECKKTMTGNRDFLASMGWRIRKDSTLCVACW